MNDPTESIRRQMVAEINSAPKEPGDFPCPTWDTAELSNDFEVLGFLAPYCHVRSRLLGVEGTVMFQHQPRVYFAFEPDTREPC